MRWYLQPFKKYAAFYGRARRREYWTFAIINTLITSAMGGVGASAEMLFLPGIFAAIIFIPQFAVLVRRLHDVGKGGAYLLIYIIPLVGQILLFINLLKDSDYGDNKFGPNPKR